MNASLKQFVAPFQLKAVRDTGTFEGYASVYGNVDRGGDIVEPGAFKEFVTNSDGKLVVLWQHDARAPIGTASFRSDDHGLHVQGSLVMEDAHARAALAHMKAKSVEGMSFGYDILPGGAQTNESGVRRLLALKVWEASVVTWGMNPLARVQAAKSALECADVRELEHLLHDQLSLSSRKSKAAASALWPILQNDREGRNDDREDREAKSIDQIVVELRNLTAILSKGQ